MKRIVTSVLALALSLALVAPLPAAAGERPDETHAFLVLVKGSEFFNWAYAGFIDAAKAIGPHIKTEMHGPAEWDATLEARALQQLIAKRVKSVSMTVAEANTLITPINKAIDSGIPVITFDSDSPGSKRLCFVGTDNYAAGFAGGVEMGKWLGDDARIGVSTFPGPDHVKRRLDGFRDGLASVAPGAKVVGVINDESEVTKAETQLTALLQANKDINGIFCAHGAPGPGAAAAVRNLGLQGKVHIMGFDFGLPVIELIETGEIRATVGQNPYLMGYYSMLCAYAATNRSEVPSSFDKLGFGHVPPNGIDTGVNILDKANIGIYKHPPRF